jgi:hypothetical protein
MNIILVFILFFATQAEAAVSVGPMAFPIFLKMGFSTILEFEESPTQVVLGDQNLFQVEKLEKSVVLKPLTPYASTNMFVYFKAKETKLFVLTASEDNEPTYYKKFTSLLPSSTTPPNVSARPKSRPLQKHERGAVVKSISIDKKMDFLTIDVEISADSSVKIVPSWDLVRLKYKDRDSSPSKLWSERREVQRDSTVKARFIFAKPNLPADMSDSFVVIPLKGQAKSLSLDLKSVKR